MIVHVEHITEIIKSINWIKYQSKISTQGQKQYLDYLIDPDSKGTKGPFFFIFQNNAVRAGHTGYFLAEVEIKWCIFMIDGWNFLDQPVKK